MTIYEQVRNILNDARTEINEKYQYQDSLVLENGINISNYHTELKVAMIALLTLGYFDRASNTFRLPNINQCIDGYLKVYSRVLDGDKFYVYVMESGTIKIYPSIPIIY
mgnify:CR=1 FL=1